MRICFFANASSIHTHRWLTYFVEKGHKVSLISLKPPAFHYERINVFVLKRIKSTPTFVSHLINFLPFIYQLWLLKRRIKFDVFHAIGSSNGLLAAIVGFKPLIFTIADPGIYSIMNKYAIRKSDLLVCDGENVEESMINLGAEPEKIKLIRFGVDIEKFKPQETSRNSSIVISTKPLRAESDVATLIRAVPKVLKEIPRARFLIVGDGDQKENLVSLAKSLKVFESVIFTGNIPSDKIPSFLNSADVFVGTSLIDTGLASSTAEAMACGLPIVVSDSGDNKLWIKNGVNGFIFPLRDFTALAEELICLLRNKNFRTKVSKTNREIIKETNDYHKEMGKMETIYKGFSSLGHSHRPWLAEKISLFQPNSILEIGCGYGANLYWLAKKIPNADIGGIDIDPKIIEKGRKFLTQKDMSHIKIGVANADEINYFEDRDIDIIFTDATLMYISPSQIEEIIQKMIRLTNKALILVEWHKEGLDSYDSHIGVWTRDYQKLLEQFVPKEQIKITRIPEELWSNKDWIKFGHIIEVKL